MFKRSVPSGFPAESGLMSVTNYGIVLSMMAAFALGGSAPYALAQARKDATTSAQKFEDMSGMYSFEREGEFVQITVEQRAPQSSRTTPGKTTPDGTKPLAVTGYISRYADTESDRGAFLDYFFAKGSLDGDKISFATKPVHGIFYEFSGTVARGASATRDKDGYYEVRGTLTQNIQSPDKTVSGRSREITMKLFPDIDHDPPKK